MEQEFKPSQLPSSVDGVAYIYGLVDPRTNQLRYVGKTKDAYHRYYDHMRARKNSHLRNWLRQVKSCGDQPEMLIIETVTTEQWPEAERFWIAYFEYIGANLCNRHGGGWGGNYKPVSEEHRANLSKALRGRKGKPLTDEHRKKLSDAFRGKKRPQCGWSRGKKLGPRPPEVGLNISAAKKGKPVKRTKPYPSLTEAQRQKISASLKGRPSPTKGMKFGPRSQEYREKLSEILTGKKKPPFTDEHRRKLSESKKGLKYPPHTPEQRRAQSEATKLRLAKKKAEQEKRDEHTGHQEWLIPPSDSERTL
jgi:hypothetical protein